MSITAVYACAKVLCETIGSLPLITYRKQVRGGKERAPEHPLYELLHDQPNGYQTSLDLRQMLQGHTTLRGNAYARIIAGARGRVDRLLPLRPDRMRGRAARRRSRAVSLSATQRRTRAGLFAGRNSARHWSEQ